MRLLRIGRSQGNEVQFDDATVSRRHAELLVLRDGRLFLTDCNSSGGTFVQSGGGWAPIRQAFVEPTDRLKFGNYSITAREIASR